MTTLRDNFRDSAILLAYVRVSTDNEDLTLQRRALRKAGCRRYYEKRRSGNHLRAEGYDVRDEDVARQVEVREYDHEPMGALATNIDRLEVKDVQERMAAEPPRLVK